mmetsp:Transcript_91614/g.245731  ORF Transcript_91614/g.245731 Transcript_91614/m.245731 type:complete len:211 (+) Transcript_91614:193-825(+)
MRSGHGSVSCEVMRMRAPLSCFMLLMFAPALPITRPSTLLGMGMVTSSWPAPLALPLPPLPPLPLIQPSLSPLPPFGMQPPPPPPPWQPWSSAHSCHQGSSLTAWTCWLISAMQYSRACSLPTSVTTCSAPGPEPMGSAIETLAPLVSRSCFMAAPPLPMMPPTAAFGISVRSFSWPTSPTASDGACCTHSVTFDTICTATSASASGVLP